MFLSLENDLEWIEGVEMRSERHEMVARNVITPFRRPLERQKDDMLLLQELLHRVGCSGLDGGNKIGSGVDVDEKEGGREFSHQFQ